MEKTTIDDLRNENPWKSLAEDLNKPSFIYNPNEKEKLLLAECDNKKGDKCNVFEDYNEKHKEKSIDKKLLFNLDPAPWIGRWNVQDEKDLPKFAILSLNPGIVKTPCGNLPDGKCNCCNRCSETKSCNWAPLADDEERLKYQALMAKWLLGEATLSEIVCDKTWQKRNGNYWGKHLEEICQSVYADQETISDDDRKKLYDKIIAIEFCPYHSFDAKAFNKDKLVFPSMNFTFRLVKFLINNGVKLFIARSVHQWSYRIDEQNRPYLTTSSNCNTSITANNCIIVDPSVGDKSKQRTVANKKKAFQCIVNSLK
jgi:hypothetical protein